MRSLKAPANPCSAQNSTSAGRLDRRVAPARISGASASARPMATAIVAA
jgi:hypothetical protein